MSKPSRSEIEAAQVFEMADTPGWQKVKEYIQNNIKAIQSNMMNKKYENMSELSNDQGELRALNKIITYVESQIKKIEQP